MPIAPITGSCGSGGDHRRRVPPRILGLIALALVATTAPSLAVVPSFRGCDTAYYLDPLCKGVGVGMKSSGVYPVHSDTDDANPAIYATVTTGNRPDPDPKDATIKTTADWQAKWGQTNQGMANFLKQEKGFTNTSRIFYLAQNGNNATAEMNDPTHPYATMAPIKRVLADLQGGAVIIRGGNWNGADIVGSISGTTLTVTKVDGGFGYLLPGDAVNGSSVATGTTIVSQLTNTNTKGIANKEGTYHVSNSQTVRGGYLWVGPVLNFGGCLFNAGNPCNVMSGSQGHPLYIMAYPGEQVVTDQTISDQSNPPYPHACCVTFDGLDVRADGWNEQYGGGRGIQMADVSNFTFVNMEFVGWWENILAENIHNVTFKHDVFHDMGFHAIYFAYDNYLGAQRDFDFAANAATCVPGWYWNGRGTKPPGEACADSNVAILDSVFYSNGDAGFEPIHLNTYLNGVEVARNYISYSGGTAIGLQTGIYHANIHDNIIFDNGVYAITFYLSANNGSCASAATLRYNTIQNNLIYVGASSATIRSKHPYGGIIQLDAADNARQHCTGHWIKNTTIKNNVIVTNNGPQGNWQNAPFVFGTGSYPKTDTIENNVIWNSSPTANVARDIVMWIAGDADSNDGASNPAATQTNYTFAQFQAYSPKFSGNRYADPKFKKTDPTAFVTNPGKFDFKLMPGSPLLP